VSELRELRGLADEATISYLLGSLSEGVRVTHVRVGVRIVVAEEVFISYLLGSLRVGVQATPLPS